MIGKRKLNRKGAKREYLTTEGTESTEKRRI
jgi:hypothetical protein